MTGLKRHLTANQIVRAIRDATDPAAAAEELRGAFASTGEVAPGG